MMRPFLLGARALQLSADFLFLWTCRGFCRRGLKILLSGFCLLPPLPAPSFGHGAEGKVFLFTHQTGDLRNLLLLSSRRGLLVALRLDRLVRLLPVFDRFPLQAFWLRFQTLIRQRLDDRVQQLPKGHMLVLQVVVHPGVKASHIAAEPTEKFFVQGSVEPSHFFQRRRPHPLGNSSDQLGDIYLSVSLL